MQILHIGHCYVNTQILTVFPSEQIRSKDILF